MTIHINLLSNFRISFDFKGSNPAVSALSNGIEDSGHEEHGNKSCVRRISDSPSHSTLVDEDGITQHPNWIAGVGDILAPSGWAERSRWASQKEGVPGPVTTWLCSKDPGVVLKPAKPQKVWKEGSKSRSALQRHCDFWDTDGDGLIYPWDIYTGFRKLGFHFTLCLWAATTMALAASYNTHTSWIPHPLFAINLNNINSNRHGSSTGTYDMDGELDERRFDAIFEKYAQGKDYLTIWSTFKVWHNQRCGLDFFGWFAGGLECKYIEFMHITYNG